MKLNFSRGKTTEGKPHIKTLHEAQYAALFRVFRRHRDVVKNVTFWNLSDADSWIGAANYPLTFDKELKPKHVCYTIKIFDPEQDRAVVKEDFRPSVCNQLMPVRMCHMGRWYRCSSRQRIRRRTIRIGREPPRGPLYIFRRRMMEKRGFRCCTCSTDGTRSRRHGAIRDTPT